MKKTLLPRLRLSPVLARRVIASAAGAFASVACVLASAACASRGAEPSEIAVTASRLTGDEMLAPVKNDEGKAQTATSTGALDTGNPFFQSLGTNGRSCGSCHVASEGWSITPAGLRARFEATGGLDPVFLRLDGADSPVAPDETIDDRRANARNLLRRGTIRVGLPATRAVATWDIDIEVLADPSNANALTATNGQVSFFRRPLPTTNLRFLAAVNWDGRNTPDPNDMRPGLLAQANGATVNHAQGAALDAATRAAIVDFETSLVTAQVSTWDAGRLDAVGASGGPVPLLGQTFTLGLSSAPRVFDLYDAWTSRRDDGEDRAKVARGQKVFDEKAFGPDNRTCSGCHAVANVGGGARFAFFDVGISDARRWNGEVPLYRVRQRSNPANVIDTTDPGRAMITGAFADVNRFKVPGLRGLAGRAPYFHDGSARSLAEVVSHYERQFDIDFCDHEKEALVAFLSAL